MKKVEYYHRDNERLVCDLCPHHCKLKADQSGICRFRQRDGDAIIALNYAEAASVAIDPVEKKPLYHFHPGSVILSVGANGCNFQCSFCQNYDISQGTVPTRHLPVDELVRIAGSNGSIGVAFTYSEPLMWYEYVLDASRALKKAGYKSVLVTNGFIEEEPLAELLPSIDAMNIDLKSLDDRFYKKLCKGRLEPVQRSIRQALDAGVHLELTHLVVTGWNDNEQSITDVVSWIASLSDEIPLHLSRYFPRHEYSEPSTDESFLQRAFNIASQELKFVYLGNISGVVHSDSLCPGCGSLLVERTGYRTRIVNLEGDHCGHCARKLPFR